jgi:hypothetical protein
MLSFSQLVDTTFVSPIHSFVLVSASYLLAGHSFTSSVTTLAPQRSAKETEDTLSTHLKPYAASPQPSSSPAD